MDIKVYVYHHENAKYNNVSKFLIFLEEII